MAAGVTGQDATRGATQNARGSLCAADGDAYKEPYEARQKKNGGRLRALSTLVLLGKAMEAISLHTQRLSGLGLPSTTLIKTGCAAAAWHVALCLHPASIYLVGGGDGAVATYPQCGIPF